jgi:hypothetical protein
MRDNTFAVIKSIPMSSYGDRIIVNKKDGGSLERRLDVLSMWGGSDKQIFGCPSWEMGSDELIVAVKWCKRWGLKQIGLDK